MNGRWARKGSYKIVSSDPETGELEVDVISEEKGKDLAEEGRSRSMEIS